MRSVFLEEGKVGNPPSGATGKHSKGSDHLQIHREFYIDSGVILKKKT